MSTDPDAPNLTPTEDLICEVLAARHRLGEPHWPFDHRLRQALDRLVGKGLVSYEPAVTPHYRARLTETGRGIFLRPGYVAPALDPNCRSFYLGPKSHEVRVDCQRPRHGEDVTHHSVAVYGAVEWVDAEAGGRASALYGHLFED